MKWVELTDSKAPWYQFLGTVEFYSEAGYEDAKYVPARPLKTTADRIAAANPDQGQVTRQPMIILKDDERLDALNNKGEHHRMCSTCQTTRYYSHHGFWETLQTHWEDRMRYFGVEWDPTITL
jgi:hypothetical protein